jgi:hypothetical protein
LACHYPNCAEESEHGCPSRCVIGLDSENSNTI